MRQTRNVLLPLNDFINAVKSKFSQVIETIAKKLKFTFGYFGLLQRLIGLFLKGF